MEKELREEQMNNYFRSECKYCNNKQSCSNYFQILPNRFVPPPTMVAYDKHKGQWYRPKPWILTNKLRHQFIPLSVLLIHPQALPVRECYDYFNPIINFMDIASLVCSECKCYRPTKELLKRHIKNYHFRGKKTEEKKWQIKLQELNEAAMKEQQRNLNNIKAVVRKQQQKYLVINYYYEFEWLELPKEHPLVEKFNKKMEECAGEEFNDVDFWPLVTPSNCFKFFASNFLEYNMLELNKHSQTMNAKDIQSLKQQKQKKKNLQVKQLYRKQRYKQKNPKICFCGYNTQANSSDTIQCHACTGWFHLVCVNQNTTTAATLKYYLCPYCDIHQKFASKANLKQFGLLAVTQKAREQDILKAQDKIQYWTQRKLEAENRPVIGLQTNTPQPLQPNEVSAPTIPTTFTSTSVPTLQNMVDSQLDALSIPESEQSEQAKSTIAKARNQQQLVTYSLDSQLESLSIPESEHSQQLDSLVTQEQSPNLFAIQDVSSMSEDESDKEKVEQPQWTKAQRNWRFIKDEIVIVLLNEQEPYYPAIIRHLQNEQGLLSLKIPGTLPLVEVKRTQLLKRNVIPIDQNYWLCMRLSDFKI